MKRTFYEAFLTEKNDLVLNKKIKLISSIENSSLNNTYIYSRVSTVNQNIEYQIYECIKYCNKNQFNVIDIITEKKSARNISNLQKLQYIINTYSNINLVIYSIDRFCRNTYDFLYILPKLKKRNINLFFVKDNIDLTTASGRHQFRTLISEAEFESDRLGERIKSSLEYKKFNNEHIGKVPYGYIKNNNVLEKNMDEQIVIDFITHHYNKVFNKDEITNNLYILLTYFGKSSEHFVPIVFEDNNGPLDNIKISYEMLSDILNDYEIYRRGELWNTNKINYIYNSHKT